MAVKYVFVLGGVVSGLGKGITAASLGRLLKARGYAVTMQKFDPYINVDPGTMNPIQHGEVFVTDDGAETDLDLGHYERFIDERLTRVSNVTSGRVYRTVLERERRGDFGGGTVQVIPHITNEIKRRFYRGEDKIAIIEVGGTVGDMESQAFLEAIRQFQNEVGKENAIILLVTLIPYLKASGEMKTKPTQGCVRELQSIGLRPDVLVCRSDYPLTQDIRDKLALFCNVRPDHVLQNLDASILYQVPLMMEDEHLAEVVLSDLGLPQREPDLTQWRQMCDRWMHPKRRVDIALVGKYTKLHDAYLSVAEALRHAGVANDAHVEIHWIDSETITPENVGEILGDMSGIIVPGGFGSRGIDGMIESIRYAREHRIPFLGLCLGMQLAIVEFARHVVGLPEAHSIELMPDTPDPVIHLMADQKGVLDIGGTLRLGSYPCRLDPDSRAFELYGDPRAPPPPLRGQQRLPHRADRRRYAPVRHVAGRPHRRDARAAGSSVFPRHAGPSGVQLPPEPPAPAVPWADLLRRALPQRGAVRTSCRPVPFRTGRFFTQGRLRIFMPCGIMQGEIGSDRRRTGYGS